jgi:hypothetical protein
LLPAKQPEHFALQGDTRWMTFRLIISLRQFSSTSIADPCYAVLEPTTSPRLHLDHLFRRWCMTLSPTPKKECARRYTCCFTSFT